MKMSVMPIPEVLLDVNEGDLVVNEMSLRYILSILAKWVTLK